MKQFTQILLLTISFILTRCFEKEPKEKIEVYREGDTVTPHQSALFPAQQHSATC